MEADFRHKLALGALLHDIGKFRQRAGLGSGPHTEIGYNWLKSQYEDDAICAPAKSHHGSGDETWLANATLVVYEADNCSASERRTRFDPQKDSDCTWQRSIRLATVFSRVSLSSAQKSDERAQPAYHPIGTADKWMQPEKAKYESDPECYRKLWRDFEEEFRFLWSNNCHYNLELVLHLLEKYTCYIPSITLEVTAKSSAETYGKHPDISLFDHSKTTAAFTLCLYDYYKQRYGERFDGGIREVLDKEITSAETWREEAEKPFLLIGGDLSGVQRFLYTISSKGALRSLKGRSFFLELLTEHVVDRLLEETGLNRCNVIYVGGGHFYLVAPNTNVACDAIKKVRQETNRWLLGNHGTVLYQCIESEPMGKFHLKVVSVIWQKLADRLENAKMRKWQAELEDVFCPPRNPHSDCLTASCKVCGREDAGLVALYEQDEADTCLACHDQWNLGKMLQRAVAKGENPVIYRYDNLGGRDRGRLIEVCGRFYRLDEKFNKEMAVEAAAVYHINSWRFGEFQGTKSRPLLAGIYMPKDDSLKELEDLVKAGMGMEKLAVLRMDVDNLGRIFSEGIDYNQRTLTRMASLSRQLSLFFKYHINGVLEGWQDYPGPECFLGKVQKQISTQRLVNIVYSGGDDLFLIGHWKDVTEAAVDIRRSFSAFTSNPSITISGGITQDHVHQPVYRLAETAGKAEQRSKQWKGGTKNRITFMDDKTFGWNKVESIKSWHCLLAGFTKLKDMRLQLEQEGISMVFLYRLLEIARRMQDRESWNIMKLAWLFGRADVTKKTREFKGLKNKVFQNHVDWHQLEVALVWLFMLMRKGEER